jgi:hypothetical protein
MSDSELKRELRLLRKISKVQPDRRCSVFKTMWRKSEVLRCGGDRSESRSRPASRAGPVGAWMTVAKASSRLRRFPSPADTFCGQSP